MNLKIANLFISDLRILRLQGFKARNGVRRILTPASPPTPLAERGICRDRLAFYVNGIIPDFP